jgi:fructokinase
MTHPSVLCFGELLIDMIATNTGSLIESDGFLKKFGGAPANTACGLAKLGTPVAFMGKVGNDPFGHFLKQTLEQNSVSTDHLVLSNIYPTTLAFVSLTENGERDFVFYKGAHDTIEARDLSLPKDLFLFHFGSLTQITDTAKKTTNLLLKQAKKQETIISYDPNIRESLWKDLSLARNVILKTAHLVDIMKLNEEEALLLSGTKNIDAASQQLFSKNLDALFITLGSKGCYYKTKKFEGLVSSGMQVDAIDTTGAGDAFNAGYIYARLEENKPFSNMDQKTLEKRLKQANIIAALTTTKKGAITAFPTKNELAHYI